jgi:hypothetical protein
MAYGGYACNIFVQSHANVWKLEFLLWTFSQRRDGSRRCFMTVMAVWGCPVYVLDKTLGNGKKISKWKLQSKQDIQMGKSPKHFSTVPLVLNPETGAITVQFHVIFMSLRVTNQKL